jgi:radical SAM-linked protein
LRFASHRDFQRAFERALRRVDAPMAYSAGFTPHPKISYANAAPTGAGSEAEYLEIGLARRCDPDRLRADLDAALPTGLDVVAVVESPPGPASLAERLQASVWEIRLPGLGEDGVARALAAFLTRDRVEVERRTATGSRVLEARAPVVRADVLDGPDRPPEAAEGAGVGSSNADRCAILRLVVRHVTPAVRPDDVLTALRAVADLAPPSPPVVTRLAQGPLDEAVGMVADPLAADPDAVER